MKIVLGILLAFLIGYMGIFSIGYHFGQESVEPQQIIESRTDIKFIPVELRPFEDEAELVKFLNERDRTVRFVGYADLTHYDNFALDLVKQARTLGYDVWLQWMDDHWGCMTAIQGDTYSIEAGTNEYWR